MITSQSRRSGFFSELTTTLRHLKLAIDTKQKIFVNWNKNNNLYYDSRYGENVWEYYFNQIDKDFDPTEKNIVYGDYIPITNIDGLNVRETFSFLYKNYITLNDETKKLIDEATLNIDENILGVHIRKTDKYLASSFGEPMSYPVSDEFYFKHINKKLETYSKIYLATDCSQTYARYKELYGDLIIDNEKKRGFGIYALHTNNSEDGYLKGLECLIESYALSKCGFLIRATSNLSSFSMFLNTSIECENMNEIYKNDNREQEFNIISKK